METREAYRICERIVRDAAANFSYGIRLLPPHKRRAMSAVYAFARRVDDIGDGSLPGDEKLAALGAERAAVERLGDRAAADAGDAIAVALADARERFELPLD